VLVGVQISGLFLLVVVVVMDGGNFRKYGGLSENMCVVVLDGYVVNLKVNRYIT
jgi:hypothetical protein